MHVLSADLLVTALIGGWLASNVYILVTGQAARRQHSRHLAIASIVALNNVNQMLTILPACRAIEAWRAASQSTLRVQFAKWLVAVLAARRARSAIIATNAADARANFRRTRVVLASRLTIWRRWSSAQEFEVAAAAPMC